LPNVFRLKNCFAPARSIQTVPKEISIQHESDVFGLYYHVRFSTRIQRSKTGKSSRKTR